MKFIELKDLNQGDNIILAWRDDDNYWWPYNVIVRKEKVLSFMILMNKICQFLLINFSTYIKEKIYLEIEYSRL